jgi:hypothetical protein
VRARSTPWMPRKPRQVLARRRLNKRVQGLPSTRAS